MKTGKTEPTRPPSRSSGSLSVRTPEELLIAVPHLLTFHPTESLVAVVLDGTRVVLTARVDLSEEIGEQADQLQQAALTNGGDGLVLVAYSAETKRTRSLLTRLLDHFDRLEIHDALVTSGSRWWSVLSAEQSSSVGRKFSPGVEQLARYDAGFDNTPLPDRGGLAELVAGPPPEQEPALRRELETVLSEIAGLSTAACRTWVAHLIVHFDPAVGLSERECAALTALVHLPEVREEAIEHCGVKEAPRLAALWLQVVRRSPPPFALAPLCLLGLVSWLVGNGAMQVVCLERAEQLNPSFSMVRMLHEINRAAVPPRVWEQG